MLDNLRSESRVRIWAAFSSGIKKPMIRLNSWVFVLFGFFENPCLGTEGRNRTGTMSPSPDFESGASTSSATPAKKAHYIEPGIKMLVDFAECILPDDTGNIARHEKERFCFPPAR
jgi:hypothetical protein